MSMEFLKPEVVRDLGFPIAISVSMFFVLVFTFRWIVTYFMGQVRDLNNTHRVDIKEVINKMTASLDKTTESFQLSIKRNDERAEERHATLISSLQDQGKKIDTVLHHVTKNK